MKLEIVALVAVLTLGFSGCLSTEVSRSEVAGVDHIVTRDYGWKLFNVIPLFRSDLTNDRVQTALFEEAAKRHKKPVNLSFHNYDSIFLEIPIIGFSIPIPYLVCYYDIQLSGELQ